MNKEESDNPMYDFEEKIRLSVIDIIHDTFAVAVQPTQIQISYTPADHAGDFTLTVFPLLKVTKLSPEKTAELIGSALLERLDFLTSFEVVKGFLNVSIAAKKWKEYLVEISEDVEFGQGQRTGEKIVLEYCGPNTNKPLHLGHVRNMLLGYSVSKILAFAGHDVVRVNIYNDRGIAICKSMIAWQEYGDGETPESSGWKGDKLVGKYYVLFDTKYREEIREQIERGVSEEEAEKNAPIMQAAYDMLRKWEAGDEQILTLWKMMNSWVYEGFETTYQAIGIDFLKAYYESDTYLKGKELVIEGLEKGIFYKKEDGSIWVDLTTAGLDNKVLLRSDGTSVYLTQDLGTALERYRDFQMSRSIYVVANEQDYHFKVLKLTLQKLKLPFADGIFHLSYGMVDLPSGKMKSREGTVVDADDLIAEMIETAENFTRESGKIAEFTEAESKELFRKIGLGALKYFILRVDPKKRMLFNPAESIDLHGNTGSFIQYTHARIQSVLKKGGGDKQVSGVYEPNFEEIALIRWLYRFPATVRLSAEQYDPAGIGAYTYELAKLFNRFYTEHSILNDERTEAVFFRIMLSKVTARVIAKGLDLLGIEAPERM